jgi:hypothetical protein
MKRTNHLHGTRFGWTNCVAKHFYNKMSDFFRVRIRSYCTGYSNFHLIKTICSYKYVVTMVNSDE